MWQGDSGSASTVTSVCALSTTTTTRVSLSAPRATHSAASCAELRAAPSTSQCAILESRSPKPADGLPTGTTSLWRKETQRRAMVLVRMQQAAVQPPLLPIQPPLLPIQPPKSLRSTLRVMPDTLSIRGSATRRASFFSQSEGWMSVW